MPLILIQLHVGWRLINRAEKSESLSEKRGPSIERAKMPMVSGLRQQWICTRSGATPDDFETRDGYMC